MFNWACVIFVRLMEEKHPKEYPNENLTIRRSKRRISIVLWWYLRLMWLFAGMMLILACIGCFTNGGITLVEIMPVYGGISVWFALFYSFINKGSLVETVHIDYIQQEIRVLRYSLWGRQFKVVIPFKGFTWDELPGGNSPYRLRLFPLADNRIVICEGSLGWTGDDCVRLKEALSEIVEKDFWLNKKPSGQW